jgi:hypothetical protein
MDQLDEYRRIICFLIREYGQYESSVGDIRTEVVIDEAGSHYGLMQTGWIGYQRVHGYCLHIDLRDGLVWIEHNGTEDPIASRLVEMGIPRDRIVLGFRPPDARGLTGFAVA